MQINTDKLARWIGGAATLFCLYQSTTALVELNVGDTLGDNIGAVFVAIMRMILWGMGAALLVVTVFLRDFAQGMVESLLAPRRFLRDPAPVLSPVHARMLAGDFDGAREQLEQLIATHPNSPAVWWARVELELKRYDYDAAMKPAEAYFSLRYRTPGEANLKMLETLTVRAETAPQKAWINDLIREELHHHRLAYTPPERRKLKALLVSR